MRPAPALPLAFLLASIAGAQAHPRDAQIHDPDTKAWWHTTEALSGDDMQGRDTGSAAYQRAADYVAKRFALAGLKPAGDAGTWFQSVPMHEIAADPAGTSFALIRKDGSRADIPFLQDVTFNPAASLPVSTTATLTFRGYCGKDAMQDVAGKIVVCFGTQRQGLPSGTERAANARAGGAAGIVSVDDPGFTIEPPRWPAAYARTVTLLDHSPSRGTPLLSMRISDKAFATMLTGTRQDANAIFAAGGAKQPLPSFDIPARLEVKLHLTQRTYASPNILAVLPGSDPELAQQYVVIAAHLDGYGFGTAVHGDSLYNGALDDAAYVALLIQFADDLKAQHLHPKRSILFAAFTGEEKGLLGSNYFVDHPTLPKDQFAADINLDQLRPLFPLKILTAEALDQSTLGASATQVGASLGIELRPDKEPERNLLRRADQYPFLRIGVPAISFIFGYDPNTDAERRYREWYQVRYHRPQDDLTQPIDFDAAHTFNTFFYTLTQTIANVPDRPHFLPNSPFATQTK